ncbi:MAG TPA: slipin family protein [Acidimicrobiales bacterium]|nr:slipin family protein [Acidimicrobiales bacterium]
MTTLALTIGITAAAAAAVWRALVRTTVVYEGHCAVRYRRGVVAEVLEPGLHRTWRPSSRVEAVDLRPQYQKVPGQEVLTADGVGLKLSLAAVYQVADVRAALAAAASYQQAAYLVLQLALREVVGARSIDEVLSQRGEIGAQLAEVASGPLAAMGLRLQSCDVKDVMFPGELRRVFAQVAEARQEGLAALERARGETAALRNLANAARAVAGNPALLQLRMLQAMEASTGHTFVIGRSEGSLP